jgi:hypothetical protein
MTSRQPWLPIRIIWEAFETKACGSHLPRVSDGICVVLRQHSSCFESSSGHLICSQDLKQQIKEESA